MNVKKYAEFFLIGVLCLTLFVTAATASYLLLETLNPSRIGVKLFSPVGWNWVYTHPSLGLSKLPKLYLIQSGSMAPTIKVGSIVVTLPSETYNQGDIISFTRGRNVITHRIYAKTFPAGVNSPALYKTAGDANEDFDNWEIKDEDIIGKVVFTLPYLGYIADFAKKPQGFILLVIVPATIIIYEEIRSLLAEITGRAVLFFKKRRNRTLTALETVETHRRYGLPKASILVPAIGSFLVIVAISASFFLDKEKSANNILGAAETFFSPTVSPTSEPSPTTPPTPHPTTTPQELHLVINELMVHPSQSPDWVEIYNPTTFVIDLSGWTIVDSANNILNLSGSISSGSYLAFDYSNRLNNSRDTVYLKDSAASIIDTHTYLGDPGENISIGRDPDGSAGFKSCVTATKGASNNGNCP